MKTLKKSVSIFLVLALLVTVPAMAACSVASFTYSAVRNPTNNYDYGYAIVDAATCSTSYNNELSCITVAYYVDPQTKLTTSKSSGWVSDYNTSRVWANCSMPYNSGQYIENMGNAKCVRCNLSKSQPKTTYFF